MPCPSPSVKTVILDTNALMMPFQFGVDPEAEVNRIFGVARIVTLSSMLGELRRLAERRPEARAALRYAERFDILNTESGGDDSLIEMAERLNAVVVTNDRRLRKRLRERGITVLYMREKRGLAVDGAV